MSSDKKIWYFGNEQDVSGLLQERGIIRDPRVEFGGYQEQIMGLKFDIEDSLYGNGCGLCYFIYKPKEVRDLFRSFNISMSPSKQLVSDVARLEGREITLYRIDGMLVAGFSAGCELEVAVESA